MFHRFFDDFLSFIFLEISLYFSCLCLVSFASFLDAFFFLCFLFFSSLDFWQFEQFYPHYYFQIDGEVSLKTTSPL